MDSARSSVGEESTCNAGDPGLVPGSRRSPGEGNGNPLQYSCLENPMDRGAWCATVHGVTRVGHNLETKSPLFSNRTYYFHPFLLICFNIILVSQKIYNTKDFLFLYFYESVYFVHCYQLIEIICSYIGLISSNIDYSNHFSVDSLA